MPFSFYENQEATERSFLWGAVWSHLMGCHLLAFACFYLAWHSEDEERVAEEEMLDLSEPDLAYTLSVQKERVVEYHIREFGFWSRSSAPLYEYLMEDLAYEKAVLEEIYEFPVSNILSNNCYIIPSDERLPSLWYELASQLQSQRAITESSLSSSRVLLEETFSLEESSEDEETLEVEAESASLYLLALRLPLTNDFERSLTLLTTSQLKLLSVHPWNGNL